MDGPRIGPCETLSYTRVRCSHNTFKINVRDHHNYDVAKILIKTFKTLSFVMHVTSIRIVKEVFVMSNLFAQN